MIETRADISPAAEVLQPLAVDVVSVQSQVVYGRVGNNVAVPTLESFGLTVAVVPTVLFSNTPHYPTLHGGAIPVDWFAGYLQDLQARGALGKLRAVATGYLGSAEQAATLGRWLACLTDTRDGLLTVVDPVIGDHDHGIYVSPELVDAHRRHLLPLAVGLTPNGFELEQLTGRPAAKPDEVLAAARTLLVGRTQWIVVTSAGPDAWTEGTMQVAVVTRESSEVITHPRIDIAPKGTGDLFSAALIGGLLGGDSVFDAAASACDAVVAALRLTREARCAELLLPKRVVLDR